MAAKFESITKRIPWSLLLKPLLLGVLAAFTPFWMFGLVALAVYFWPWFRPRPLLLQFFLALFLAFRWGERALTGALLTDLSFGTVSLFRVGSALMAGLLFALIFGIKDLHIVRRDTALRVLNVALLFFISLEAFLLISGNHAASRFLIFPALAFLAVQLLAPPPKDDAPEDFRTFPLVAGTLLTEVGIVLAFLPVASTVKASLFFLSSVIVFELQEELALRGGSFKTILRYFSALLFISALVLMFSKWGI